MLKGGIRKWFVRYRHIIFLSVLIFTLFFSDITSGIFGDYEFLANMVMLLLGSLALTHSKRSRLNLGLIMLLLMVVGSSQLSGAFDIYNLIFFIILFFYFAYITYILFWDMLHTERVTFDMILGALSGYILMGIQGFFIFSFLLIINPDSLNVELDPFGDSDKIMYFSYVTLTTIGYGDISPVTNIAQKLAVLIGLIGQFYIATVMAIMVGKFLSRDLD